MAKPPVSAPAKSTRRMTTVGDRVTLSESGSIVVVDRSQEVGGLLIPHHKRIK